jgi:hypothetical protein
VESGRKVFEIPEIIIGVEKCANDFFSQYLAVIDDSTIIRAFKDKTNKFPAKFKKNQK